MENSGPDLETLVSLAKRRGFVWPASEIYGGLSGFYNYGPYGAQMVRNIKAAWWDAFVRSVPNIHGLDSSIIQNPKLWEASGHVEQFNDPMVECQECSARFRTDHLIEEHGFDWNEYLKTEAGEDKQDDAGAKTAFLNEKVKCPGCGKMHWGQPKTFNMMFKTEVGPAGGEDSAAYLRPETAGAIFADFDLVREATRSKIPFGIAQIGKAFRNEISPREFLFRLRELEQMEIEYFVRPENAEEELNNMKQICWDWLKTAGLKEENLSWHEHGEDERAHYAADSWDIDYKYPFGPKELWGIANRTDYDLKAHSKSSGKKLDYFDPKSNERFVPYVIEPSIGVDRLFLALMHSAYNEEEVKGEKRVVLKLEPGIAPIDIAVLPLSNKPELGKKAHEVYGLITGKTDYTVEYDETQSIGKRYRRQDEIGTPKCVTVDFDTLEDNQVTIRDRDSMEQERVPIDELLERLG